MVISLRTQVIFLFYLKDKKNSISVKIEISYRLLFWRDAEPKG